MGLTEVQSDRLVVVEVLGDPELLEPDGGARLARSVTERVPTAEDAPAGMPVVLDFTGTGTIASSFANAFFLGLARHRPLADWPRLLDLRGLGSRQRLTLTSSLTAIRKELAGGGLPGR